MTRVAPTIVSSIVYLLSISAFLYTVTAEEEQWSFIVLADWHSAEALAVNPHNETVNDMLYDQIHHVKNTYGGELVVLPGDSNVGKWDTEAFASKFRPELKRSKRVLLAGRNCYGAMRAIFVEAGYDHILIAVGDHELGGNKWIPQSSKVKSLGKYRQGFKKSFNEEPETGEFLFKKAIGSAPSRPLNTPFKRTSYAHQHKNVLFITLDAFLKMPDVFFDRDHGLGGEGMITCTIEGEHLNWFENVLIEARKDETIKHIIVQAHLPIIQPVRKVSCSGQFMDHGEESALWKTMVKYNVDVYLAGEVHTNTVTKDSISNLIQVVSRGNSFNNFLKIDVTDNTLNITSYNEIGPKRRNNHNYEAYGNLVLNKAVICPTIGDGIFVKPNIFSKDNTMDSAQKNVRLDTLDSGSRFLKKSALVPIACGSGSSGVCGSAPHKWVEKNTKHAVKCCSDAYIDSPSTEHYPGRCPFAATCFSPSTFDDLPFSGKTKGNCDDGLCSGKVRYNQAMKLCNAVGGSLCTLRDLVEDCAQYTGCNYDNVFVWARANDRTESPSTAPTPSPSGIPSSSPSSSTTSLPSDSPSYSRLPTTIPSIEPTLAPRCTHISSSGVLELLNRTSALIHLDFEETMPLRKRQVVGMQHEDVKKTLVGSRIMIRGVRSEHSLPNKGSFNQPYDAQVANVELQYSEDRSYGVFTNRSRLAVYGTGPHSGGSIISYALWIKTKNSSDMALVHYGHYYGGNSQKHIYTLTLQNGDPMLYISPTAILRPESKHDLNDGNWHHIAVSMPRKSCKLSEVIIYVDGKAINTVRNGYDGNIFFTTSGRLSIGGFGYSHKTYEENFPHLSPFIGMVDEFYTWGRALKGDDVKLVMGI